MTMIFRKRKCYRITGMPPDYTRRLSWLWPALFWIEFH